jgi:hypothetical protein
LRERQIKLVHTFSQPSQQQLNPPPLVEEKSVREMEDLPRSKRELEILADRLEMLKILAKNERGESKCKNGV